MRDFKILKRNERELLIEIQGEDHTLGNLIAKEALNHSSVAYASYNIPHPLQDKLLIYISVKEGSDPVVVFKEICFRIKDYLNEFRKEIEGKIVET
ncbi:MAG: DNA-directed RNA polymerase subunit L [Desulfurococcaceae archaeon]|uniref:DNA-directed RNA polymerase subunit Rpo11 n=1 Tax=Staphylothermus marinus TaxID=2280 RepID=A0A7C4DAJ9_STAMA